jgi:hypothetical protein
MPLLKWISKWLFLPLEEEATADRLIQQAIRRATSTRWWKADTFVDSRYMRS